jgi:hypothetical protein
MEKEYKKAIKVRNLEFSMQMLYDGLLLSTHVKSKEETIDQNWINKKISKVKENEKIKDFCRWTVAPGPRCCVFKGDS